MDKPETKTHPIEWFLLALVFVLPVLVSLPFVAFGWCYWHCIPPLVDLTASSRWLVYPLVSTLAISLVWALKVSRKQHRFFLVVITLLSVVLAAFSLFFSVLLTLFLGSDRVTEVHVPDTNKTYYVVQYAGLPEGYSFRLYEKHGLLKTAIGRTQWRWNSIELNGAVVNLVPEEGYDTNYTFNVTTGELGRGAVFEG